MHISTRKLGIDFSTRNLTSSIITKNVKNKSGYPSSLKKITRICKATNVFTVISIAETI